MTIDHTADLLARLAALPESDRHAILALVDALTLAPTPAPDLPAYARWWHGPRQDALNLLHRIPTED